MSEPSESGVDAKDDTPLTASAMVPPEGINLQPDVAAAIAKAFPSDDPIDDPEFDTVKHINTLFPNEQSLSKLEAFMGKLKGRIRRIDNEIQSSVRGQSASDTSGQALKDAQVGMADLFSRIQDIRKKAEVSERMVQEITRDIRSLDYAKKHLTASITTLNHLKMLVGGVDSLQMLADNGQYRDAANILSAMQNVLEHFERYREIPRITALHERVDKIKLQMSQQINAEFRKAFRRPEPDRSCDIGQLAEGCAVIDVLDEEEQNRFKSWFVNLQLRDYRDVFNINEDAAWVDKIDRRFAWLKRTLASYAEKCSGIFPREWYLQEVITERFLEITREDLVQMIATRRDALDVKLLLFALKKSTEFEQWLVLRFPSREYEDIEEKPEEPIDRPADRESGGTDGDAIRNKYRQFQEEKQRALERERAGGQPPRRLKPNKFIGRVSKIFEGCMDVYITAQDRTLEGMLEAFVRTYKAEGMGGAAEDGEDEAGKTLDSSGDMFRFFRECIITCVQLNSQPAIFELYLLFKKYLNAYCERMLTAHLPQTTSIASVILKDASVKLTPEEQFLTCCILNTAEYCMETTAQLEGKLKQKMAPEKVEEVDMAEEQDKFHEVISNAIQLLVRALETQCESSLTTMAKTKWEQIEEVGDTSLYVSQMGKNMATMVPFIRSSFSSDRKYFTNFCMKFVNSFIPRLMTYIYKCKVGTSHVGAEQLLLDMQSVRQLLLELPTLGSATARKPTSSYTRYVTKMTTKTEMILKVVMAPHDPPQLYVEDYTKLIGEEEGISMLQTILEMKCLKRAEQQPILDAYKAIAPNGGADSDRSSKAPESRQTAAVANTKQRSIRKLERLMKRWQ